MDERLEKALEFSNYMITLNNQRTLIQEKFKEQATYYYKGGKFHITRELMSYLYTLVAKNQKSTILIDDNNIPIEINDVEKFQEELYDTYFQAANLYLTEYNKIKTNRNVKGLVDL